MRKDLRVKESRVPYYSQPLRDQNPDGMFDTDIIIFKSRKYKLVSYHIQAVSPLSVCFEAIDAEMHKLTAQKLGYKDWFDWALKVPDLNMRFGELDKKTGCYPAYFSKPTRYPQFDNMTFKQIMYGIVWPEIKNNIDEFVPPVREEIKFYTIGKNAISFQVIVGCEKLLTVDIIDDWIFNYYKIGEPGNYVSCNPLTIDTDWLCGLFDRCKKMWYDERKEDNDAERIEKEHEKWLVAEDK